MLSLAVGAVRPTPALGSTPLLVLGTLRIGVGGPFPQNPRLRAYITTRPNEVLTSDASEITYNPLSGLYTLDLGLFSTWLASDFLAIEVFDIATGSFGQTGPTLIQPYRDDPNLPLPIYLVKPAPSVINRVGDVNLDGSINGMDVRHGQYRLYGAVTIPTLGPGALVDGDTVFALKDLLLIAQRVSGKRSGLVGNGNDPASIFVSSPISQLTDEMVAYPIPFFTSSGANNSTAASKVNGLMALYFLWPPSSDIVLAESEGLVTANGFSAPLTVNQVPTSTTLYAIINLYDSEGVSVVASAYASIAYDAILNSCGDGFVGPYEACDDNNATNGDGCSADCKREVGGCGDGMLTVSEICDDGDVSTCGGDCLPDCSGFYSWTCGDGVIECGEDCDDANLLGGDGCSADCAIQPTAYPFVEDFETTALPYWSFGGGANALSAFDSGEAYHGAGQLSVGAAAPPSTGYADLAINLKGKSGVLLRFAFKSFNFFGTSMPSQFAGSSDGDGIAVSLDGVSWRRLIDLSTFETGQPVGQYVFYDLDLDAAVAGFGWAYPDFFRLRFQHTAYDAFPTDGGVFDWVELSPGQCGDGIQQAPEICDDGDSDNCTSTCDALCGGSYALVCGDGLAECGEACDDGDNDDCTPVCDAICSGPGIVAVCGDGLAECGEGCDDANTIPGDGCDEFCQPECVPLTCPSTYEEEQIVVREASWPDGFGAGGWIHYPNLTFNNDEVYYSYDPSWTFTGYFNTSSVSELFHVWQLGYRNISTTMDRSMEIRIDGDWVGIYDDSFPAPISGIEWQYIGAKNLVAGPHTYTVRSLYPTVSYYDGTALTTDALLDPQLDFLPLKTFNLDDPLLDWQGPGPPIPECCGDCDLQVGETCDDGNLFDGDGCSNLCLVE